MAPRRSARRPRRRHGVGVEVLEPRLALANLALSSIELVDGNGQQIAAPIIGQLVFYRARWTATGLASSATYVVRYTIDGVSVESSPLTLGNGTWSWYRGITYASPGPHQVSIAVDGGDAVAESNESDNTLTTSFTPVLPGDLPQKFAFPVAGVPHRDYSIGNYADVDPRSGSRADFRGGPFQYDGHDAIDVGPATFGDQDRGVPILAAAAGTVTEVVDGHFDRETSMSSRPGNYVRIDHGNGWQTNSWHFAADSIVVKAGDAVAQGQLLGLMGSSGSSTFSHLHWGVRYRGAPVETFYAPTSYWVSPPVYQGDAPPTVMRSGIANYDVGPELAEGPSSVTVFPTTQTWSAWYWYRLSNLPLGARMTVTWFRPDGSVHATFERTPEGQRESSWYWNIGTAWRNVPGTWSAAVSVNGVELDRQSFTVVSGGGEPEAAIYEAAAPIVDGRVTPIDFGTVAAGAAAVERTFTITNRGAATLTTALAPLPSGFSLVGGFPASVPANGSAPFTVRLDTAVVGRKLGEIRIDTNDRDEAESTFLVGGEVTGTAPPGRPVVTLPGPAVPYLGGSGPVVIDAGADLGDADATTWSGAALRVEILTNGTAADRLAVRHQGTGAGQVGVAGGAISYGGQQIATATGGVGTTPLVISFTQAATLPAVRAVLRALTYSNVAMSPETRPRFLGVSVSDATGAASERQVKRVSSMTGGRAPALRPGLDLDGNGVADVVWANAQGQAEAWLDGDAGRVRPLGGGGGWSLAATGDFNDDGVGDLVWRDGNGGYVAWLMAADGRATTTGFLGGGGSWALEATGDYDGDGRTDLVWRNSVSGANVQWLMNGVSPISATFLGGTPDWRLVATDERFDADGDGRTDVVWRHGVSGVNVLVRMNGSAQVSSRVLGGDTTWRIVGSGDFDGDGQSDVLWRGAASGGVVMHVMSDGAVRESGFVGGDLSWSVAGTQRSDATRRSRLFWRHAGGTVVRQEMNGRVVESSETIRSSTVWRLLGRPGAAVA